MCSSDLRDKNNRLYGIMLNDERSDKYSITITAESGDIVAQDGAVYLRMENGTLQRSNYSKESNEILNFDDYIFNLTKDKEKHGEIIWKSKERYFHELINNKDELDESKIKSIISEIHERITYPMLPLILTLIAISAMMYGQFNRRGNLKNIITTIICGVTFMSLNIISYELIEYSFKLTPIVYLEILITAFLAIKFAIDKEVK